MSGWLAKDGRRGGTLSLSPICDNGNRVCPQGQAAPSVAGQYDRRLTPRVVTPVAGQKKSPACAEPDSACEATLYSVGQVAVEAPFNGWIILKL